MSRTIEGFSTSALIQMLAVAAKVYQCLNLHFAHTV